MNSESSFHSLKGSQKALLIGNYGNHSNPDLNNANNESAIEMNERTINSQNDNSQLYNKNCNTSIVHTQLNANAGLNDQFQQNSFHLRPIASSRHTSGPNTCIKMNNNKGTGTERGGHSQYRYSGSPNQNEYGDDEEDEDEEQQLPQEDHQKQVQEYEPEEH